MESEATATEGRLKVILLISILLNAALASAVVFDFLGVRVPDQRYSDLAYQNQNLTRTINSLKQETTMLQSQLSYYKAQAEYYSRILRLNKTRGDGAVGRSEINIVAVRQVSDPVSGFAYEGVVLTVHLEIREGEGRLLINTRPKIGIDLQTSANTAILVAENVTGLSLRDSDVILTVTADSETEVLDGPSAGAAITVALITAIRNQTVDSTAFITGTISPDGSVGRIGGVLEKAAAAAKFGARRFLVPTGQSTAVTYRTEKSQPAPGLTIITTRPELVSVEDYLREQGFSLEVREVANIMQAYDLLVSRQS
ncbi:MAG: S16 family serine protease [Candidatus Bathyarchaeia archaeon]